MRGLGVGDRVIFFVYGRTNQESTRYGRIVDAFDMNFQLITENPERTVWLRKDCVFPEDYWEGKAPGD